MADDEAGKLVRRLPVPLRAPFTEDVIDFLSSQIDASTLDALISEFDLTSSKAQEVRQLPESKEQARELLMYWYKRTTLTSNKVKVLAKATSKVGRHDITDYLMDLLPKDCKETEESEQIHVDSTGQEHDAES